MAPIGFAGRCRLVDVALLAGCALCCWWSVVCLAHAAAVRLPRTVASAAVPVRATDLHVIRWP